MGTVPRPTFAFVARAAVAMALAGVVAVYAAEAAAIGLEYIHQLKRPRDYDSRTRLEILADLRRSGVDAIINPSSRQFLRDRADGSRVSAFTSGGREFLPLSGVAHRTAVVCNEDGRFLVIQPDQYGFNNPPGVWRSSPI